MYKVDKMLSELYKEGRPRRIIGGEKDQTEVKIIKRSPKEIKKEEKKIKQIKRKQNWEKRFEKEEKTERSVPEIAGMLSRSVKLMTKDGRKEMIDVKVKFSFIKKLIRKLLRTPNYRKGWDKERRKIVINSLLYSVIATEVQNAIEKKIKARKKGQTRVVLEDIKMNFKERVRELLEAKDPDRVKGGYKGLATRLSKDLGKNILPTQVERYLNLDKTKKMVMQIKKRAKKAVEPGAYKWGVGGAIYKILKRHFSK